MCGQDRVGGERPSAAGAEPGLAGAAQAGDGRKHARRHGRAERRALLRELERGGESLEAFSARHGLRAETVAHWQWRERVEPGTAKTARRAPKRSYTPEERRAAVEAFHKSGRSRPDFARLWGLSNATLGDWLRRHEREGPKGLERRAKRRLSTQEDPRRLPVGVRAQIARIKISFPHFGLRRVRDFLWRFGGRRVSAGSVARTLREEGLSTPPPPRRRRGPAQVRRFERSRPGELWQSDITSFLLRRHGTRVYLVVFLDDFSRYVVGWGLATRQTCAWVCEVLLEALARYGKPREILSDQGRQYFAWRGKSGFQKLLAREGIAHVVSRTHHPQTLGKCERLWKSVGEEFWERVRPEDLAEARDRLSHFFSHYNFFRPHQGIDGLVPADRFFGAQSALRAALEAGLARDELGLALCEEPRQSVYLFGQIGEQSVSLHGERGRLVVHTPGGVRQELSLEGLGAPGRPADERQKEVDDAATASGDLTGDGHGRGGDEHGVGHADTRESGPGAAGDGAGGGSDAAAAAGAHGPQAPALRGGAAAGAGGEVAVACGELGGAPAGAPDVHGDPGVLAGQEEQGGCGAGALGASAAGLAAVAIGALGDDGGAAAPAAQSCARGAAAAAPRERPREAETANRGAGAQAGTDGGPGAGAAGPAVEACAGGERWSHSRATGQGEPAAAYEREGGQGTPNVGAGSGPSSAGRPDSGCCPWDRSDELSEDDWLWPWG